MTTAAQLRKLALAMPGAEEKSHFGQPDFRVRDKIFCGLSEDGKSGTLKLTPEIQSALLGSGAYTPASGAWGAKGWTRVELAKVNAAELKELIAEAFALVAPKTQKSPEVEAFIKTLKHPFKKELEEVRKIVLGASKKVQERVKWKAPSFYFKEDLGAFNLHKKEFLHLILVYPKGVEITDDPILEGKHRDRREVKFHSAADVRTKKRALQAIVRGWVEAVEAR